MNDLGGRDLMQLYREIGARANTSYEAQVALPRLLSGDATFAALAQAVEDLRNSVPQDHDVLIQAFGVIVTQVRYVEPHTFVFSGFDPEGHETFVACHFS